ncbi:hypothetical protein KDH10_002662 [Shewanella vesiculosa]|nr:hypothetical protein [Shewanella vesiculosa]UJL41655.1 hypothetical protein KDH10_002662 [Shewanella vesiculosa]
MAPVSNIGSVYHRQEPVMKGQAMPVQATPESTFSAVELTDNDVNFSTSSEPYSGETQSNQTIDDVLPQADIEQDNTALDADAAIDDQYTSSFSTASVRNNQPLYVDQDALQSGSITELAKSWLNVAKLHQQKLILIGKITALILAICLVVYLVFALVNVFF